MRVHESPGFRKGSVLPVFRHGVVGSGSMGIQKIGSGGDGDVFVCLCCGTGQAWWVDGFIGECILWFMQLFERHDGFCT